MDIRFSRTGFDEVVSAIEKFSGVKTKPSYFTGGFDGNFQTPMHTKIFLRIILF
jgi:hypothetical protein